MAKKGEIWATLDGLAIEITEDQTVTGFDYGCLAGVVVDDRDGRSYFKIGTQSSTWNAKAFTLKTPIFDYNPTQEGDRDDDI